MNKKINLIIVDDEEEAREGIRVIVSASNDYHLLAVAKNGLEAITLINEKKPDLVLLDIQMPEINGFDVLNNLDAENKPFIIFVTAYDNYAIKAFEHHAIDYILKPFTNARLFKALDLAKDRVNQQTLNNKLEHLLEDYKREKINNESNTIIHYKSTAEESNEKGHRLVVKSFGKIYFVDPMKIIWVQAYDYYVKIHIKDKFYLVRQSLKSMEAKLPSDTFFRIHKSNIVNVNHVLQTSPKNNGDHEFLLSTGAHVNMSRNYRDCLKIILRNR